jgi:predicted DsbA family dithiol-disulfide isomerase
MPDPRSAEQYAVLQVEVWSDVVCPWCYIGKRRLEGAIADEPGEVRIIHRAFQLDPDARTEGKRTIEVLADKYRLSQQQAADDGRGHRRGQQRRVALPAAQTITGNTFDAHRHRAGGRREQGKGQDLLEAVYASYFTQGKPVFTADELLPIAEQVALDADAAQAVLAGDAYRPEVQRDQQEAARIGANGVPLFVIDGRIGIQGAQPSDVLRRALAQVRQDRLGVDSNAEEGT